MLESHSEQDIIVITQDQGIKLDIGLVENGRRNKMKKLIHFLTFMISGIINVTKIKKAYGLVG